MNTKNKKEIRKSVYNYKLKLNYQYLIELYDNYYNLVCGRDYDKISDQQLHLIANDIHFWLNNNLYSEEIITTLEEMGATCGSDYDLVVVGLSLVDYFTNNNDIKNIISDELYKIAYKCIDTFTKKEIKKRIYNLGKLFNDEYINNILTTLKGNL